MYEFSVLRLEFLFLSVSEDNSADNCSPENCI